MSVTLIFGLFVISQAKDDIGVLNRRRSFEEGYGSFADYTDDGPSYLVDEIDMARKKSPNSSPYAKTPPLPP
jgi:hypothetical protein